MNQSKVSKTKQTGNKKYIMALWEAYGIALDESTFNDGNYLIVDLIEMQLKREFHVLGLNMEQGIEMLQEWGKK